MIALLIGTAFAVQIQVVEEVCPFGQDSVRVFSRVSENQLGGFDSDLASYSSGGQFRSYAISTCYENLFSVYGRDIPLEITAEQKAEIQTVLTSMTKRLEDPKEPQIWERYEIAAKVYESLDRSDFILARIYIEASWTARDTVVGFHQGLSGPQTISQVLHEGKKELDKDLDMEKKKVLLFNMARVSHRGGYSALRDQYLDEFEALPLSTDEKEASALFRKVSLEIEPYYQKLAIAHLEKALDPSESVSLTEEDKVLANYWLGDLNRRLGQEKRAHAAYQTVIQSPHKEERLQGFSTLFLQSGNFWEPPSP
jgi:hypothetical protein